MLKLTRTLKANNINTVETQAKAIVSEISSEIKNIVTELPNYEFCDTSLVKRQKAIVEALKIKAEPISIGTYPKEYIKLKRKEFIEGTPEHIIETKNGSRLIKAKPDSWEKIFELKPHYHLEKLWSKEKGAGSSAIKDLVKRSLADPETQGRVTLVADCIDGKTHPAGFYYKLGFRFKSENLNKIFDKWLGNGAQIEDAPKFSGEMFLPKENISKCLNYGK